MRAFDGTGRLLDQDITLEASIEASTASDQTLRMFYDVEPHDNTTAYNGSFWYPFFISPELSDYNVVNYEARVVESHRSQNGLRDFLVPSQDKEIIAGADLEFVFALGDLICARITNPADPRSLAPWLIPIDEIKAQRSGVTILNNEINPDLGEETVLRLDLSKRSMVTIQVFNLAGDLVDVIYRGSLSAGDYTYSWDGTNRAGTAVARGIYFVRVVASGIDEYRKVLVVR